MFFNYLNYIVLCFGLVFLHQTLSDDCVIYKENGIDEIDQEWATGIMLPQIYDNASVTTLFSRKTKNIKNIINVDFNTIRDTYVAVIFDPESQNLTLTLTEDFENYEEYEMQEILIITISLQCESQEKDIRINQKIVDLNNHSPKFLNAPYEYTLDMPITKNQNVDSYGVKIIARDIDISNKNVTFRLESTGDKTDGFSIIWAGQDDNDSKSFQAHLVTTELIDINNDITFMIFAKDDDGKINNSRESSTSVTIKVNNPTSALKFSQLLYTADCKNAEVGKDTDIKFDNEILLVRGAEAGITVSFSSDPRGYEKFFNYVIASDLSKITFKLKNPSAELLRKKFIILTLNVAKVRSSSSTVLFVQLPGMNDGFAAPKLYFKKEFYSLEKNVSFMGTLFSATATLENANGNIQYSINFEDNNLEKSITIDPGSAEVKLTKLMSSGNYIFDIIAKESTYNLTASVTALLVISSENMEYALRIIEVEEESKHENIISLGKEVCSYEIVSQTPNEELFYLKDNILNSKEIDRESIYFSSMPVAQVRLEIEIICPKSTLHRRIKRKSDYNLILGNIPFTHSKMNIIAIITDINDNAPLWDEKIPKVIGYPTNELSKMLSVPYIYSLSATDADIGENAKITYSVKEEDKFYVHSTTGTLYACFGVNIPNSVTVMASDGVYSTPLNQSVSLLGIENMIVLHVKNAVIEDIEKFTSSIQSNLTNDGIILGSLGAAVVNDVETAEMELIWNSKSEDTGTILRILLYGLDMKTNTPLCNKNFKSVLEATEVSSAWKILTMKPLDETLPKKEENKTDVFLIITIVLSVILGAAIAGSVILLVRCKRSVKLK